MDRLITNSEMATNLMELTRDTERLQDLSDAELVQRAQYGRSGAAPGAEAVAELYDRYHERIFHYIWSRVSDPPLAEDLTGDVFVRMVTYLPRYRPTTAPFQAWLFRIARNLIIDHVRKAGTRNEIPLKDQAEYLKDDEQNPTKVVDRHLSIEQVQNAIQELNPLRQDIVVLRFIVGLPLKDVASLLGKTVGSIKVAQHRAVKELRDILESQDLGE
jgi:RNA polymerase sigma-70 factor (ECF subfamily)